MDLGLVLGEMHIDIFVTSCPHCVQRKMTLPHLDIERMFFIRVKLLTNNGHRETRVTMD
jgi:hypothetical protein